MVDFLSGNLEKRGTNTEPKTFAKSPINTENLPKAPMLANSFEFPKTDKIQIIICPENA